MIAYDNGFNFRTDVGSCFYGPRVLLSTLVMCK
jgi:hypothetical protein